MWSARTRTAVLLTELKADIAKYLKGSPAPIAGAHARRRDCLRQGAPGAGNAAVRPGDISNAQKTKGLDDPAYKKARQASFKAAGPNGIDRLLKQYNVVALVGPTMPPAWKIDAVNGDQISGGGAGNLAAIAGYPHLTVPMGLVKGLPVGLSFIGPKWSEARLLSLGYAYEQARGPIPDAEILSLDRGKPADRAGAEAAALRKPMIKLAPALAALAFVASPAPAQQLTADEAAKVDQLVAKTLADTGVPSAEIAVVRDGRLVLNKAYGKANEGLTANAGLPYQIASNSKQFTAMALLLLRDEGKLSLDDRVSKFIPGITGGDRITIRQLLSHTSGLQDFWPQDYMFSEMTVATTPQHIVDKWAKKPLDFEPGSRWQYSNTGYVVAGMIAEKAAGEPLLVLSHPQSVHAARHASAQPGRHEHSRPFPPAITAMRSARCGSQRRRGAAGCMQRASCR